MFEENEFEVYERLERIETDGYVERKAEARRLAMNELIERMRDRFRRIEEENNADASSTFIDFGRSLSLQYTELWGLP